MTTSIVAGPGDTWGIPGPQFLWLYIGLAAVAIIGVLIWRRSITRGPSLRNARDLTSTQAALINADRRLAVYSSLAALRAAGSIETDKRGYIRQTALPPTGASELDRAIYSLAHNGITTTGVLTHATVRAILDRNEAELAQAGWILDEQTRRTVRMGALVVFGVVLLGIVRVFAGVSNNRPVTNLVLLIIPVAVIAFVLLAVPRVSSSGKTKLTMMRAAARHLSPTQKPSWSTYGPQAAALSVGLFGVGAFWLADPAFASDAELQRHITQTGFTGSSSSSDGGSSSSCSSSSSSCSGGSSCGGGGGCGGGGCGG
ncbi:TIGR04222 domain-containing membrane protein [Dactylosporangium sp. CS-033363]|uniref:TIGR04222 domain-containing membrane protein n=1 Tax=Dactylosporangium sp. CS-033363 TaxID=3239935 RepID=UPI003D90DD44